jgi:uncharacterized membrane protein
VRPPVSPFWFLFLLGLLLWLALSIKLQIIALTFEKLGLDPQSALTLMLVSLCGSVINLPLFSMAATMPANAEAVLPPERLATLRQRFTGRSQVVVNVGGCLVPLFFCFFLLRTYAMPLLPLLAGTAAIAALSYRLSRPIPGVGIGMPILIAPLTAALIATTLGGEFRAPFAYICGSLGVLIGADLLRLKDIRHLGAPVASIGGAGTFDGIFMTGLVAVLLT